MKPLDEWTRAELRDAVVGKDYVPWDRLEAMIDELLRRERERCAALCDEVAALHRESWASEDAGRSAEIAASNIRSLK